MLESDLRASPDSTQLIKWMERLYKLHQDIVCSRQWKIGNALGKAAGALRPGSKTPLAVDRMQDIFTEFESWKQPSHVVALRDEDHRNLQKWMQMLEELYLSLWQSRRWRMGNALSRATKVLRLRPRTPSAMDRMGEVFAEFEAWKQGAYTDALIQQKGKRASRLDEKLWGGFSEQALTDLEALRADPEADELDRSKAAWALARWHAVQEKYEHSLGYLAFMRALRPYGSNHKDCILLESDCLRRFGRPEEARDILNQEIGRRGYDSDLCLAYANTYIPADGSLPERQADKERLAWINKVFVSAGFVPVDKADPQEPLTIANLAAPAVRPLTSESLPMISVIVPVYNAEDTVGIALRSLMEQTWRNIEVLVVDDCSTDNTFDVLCRFAEQDSRIKPLRHEYNQGAYPARNTGLWHAKGDLITTHDSDDWSHPQKLEVQALALHSGAGKVATISDWVRATKNLRFSGTWRPTKDLIIENKSSFMFTRQGLCYLGGWDRVKITGDTEFIWRTTAIFGEQAIDRLHKKTPLSFSLHDENSLTQNKATHVSSIQSGLRREYRESAQWWHRNAQTSSALYLDPKNRGRPFPVPAIIQSDHPETENYDLVFIMDFNLQGGALSSTLNSIFAALRAEMSVGLFHWRHYEFDVKEPLHPAVRDLAAKNNLHVLVPGQNVVTKYAIAMYPPVLQYKLDSIPNIQFDNFVLVVSHLDSQSFADSYKHYDPLKVRSNLGDMFGAEGTWIPTSGLVKRFMVEDQRYPEPHLQIWLPLIDREEWSQKSLQWMGRTRKHPVIGRHTRDDYTKWPSDQKSLRDAFLADMPCEIRILGGVKHALDVMGAIPSNWKVFDWNSIEPREFLQGLDFFVHFPHQDYQVECVSAVIEAMAVGLPVILPPVFQTSLGEAALYAEPNEVWQVIQRLWRNETLYLAQARTGRDFVKASCDLKLLSPRLKQVQHHYN